MVVLRRGVSALATAVALALLAPPALRASSPPPGFVETQLIGPGSGGGVSAPTAAGFEPGTGNLFVTEQAGRVRVRDAVSGVVSTALTLPCVDSAGERGILGIAFAPGYLDPGGTSRHVYLYYTRILDNGACALAGEGTGTRFQVSRFTETSGTLHSEEVILVGPFLSAATNHNAGAIDFAPDGTLFVATGDNDTDGAANPLSRDLSDLRGKLLRINRDGSIPPDNPFVGHAGVRPEIWAWGLRNPFRFRIDPQTGTPIIADVGEVTWEAIYAGVAGADYGYPCFEGSMPYVSCDPSPPPGAVTGPIFEYGHGTQTPPVMGNSVTGGPVYRHTAFPPDYHGNYFFGDFGANWIRRGRFAPDGRLVDVEMFIPDVDRVVDILVSPDGCLVWVGVFGAGVNEVCWVGGGNGQPLAVASATPTSGLTPLNVLFTGSGSSDPDTDPLTYEWDFGDLSTGTAADTGNTYDDPGVYHAVLTVDDGRMQPSSQDSAPAIRIVAGNRAPAPAIAMPTAGSRYDAGDTITFSGSATDPDDGALPASQLSWTVVFHHDTHTHPFAGPIRGIAAGSFAIPTTGEDSTNVFFRVYLSATDGGIPMLGSGPLTSSTFVDLLPNVSDLTLDAVPAASGLELELDRQPAAAPFTVPSVVSFPRTLGAPTLQTTGSGTFFFQSWSDGGAAEHVIATPAGDPTFTATYAPCAVGDDDLTLDNQEISTPVTETACLTITAGSLYRVVAGGALTLHAGVAVILDNDFWIEEGGEVTVDLSPPV